MAQSRPAALRGLIPTAPPPGGVIFSPQPARDRGRAQAIRWRRISRLASAAGQRRLSEVALPGRPDQGSRGLPRAPWLAVAEAQLQSRGQAFAVLQKHKQELFRCSVTAPGAAGSVIAFLCTIHTAPRLLLRRRGGRKRNKRQPLRLHFIKKYFFSIWICRNKAVFCQNHCT